STCSRSSAKRSLMPRRLSSRSRSSAIVKPSDARIYDRVDDRRYVAVGQHRVMRTGDSHGLDPSSGQRGPAPIGRVGVWMIGELAHRTIPGPYHGHVRSHRPGPVTVAGYDDAAED